MLFAWSACRRTHGDLLDWLTLGFLWSLLPFIGVIAMWWTWRRASRDAAGAPAHVVSAPAWVWCGARRLPVPRADAFEPPAELPRIERPGRRRPRGAGRAAGGAAPARAGARRPLRGRHHPRRLAPLPERAGARGPPGRARRGRRARGRRHRRHRLRPARDDGRRGAGASRRSGRSPHGSRSSTRRASSPRRADLGTTSLGAPARIARRVAEADLVDHRRRGRAAPLRRVLGRRQGRGHRLRRPRDHRVDAPPGVHLGAGRHRGSSAGEPLPDDPPRDRRAHAARAGASTW